MGNGWSHDAKSREAASRKLIASCTATGDVESSASLGGLRQFRRWSRKMLSMLATRRMNDESMTAVVGEVLVPQVTPSVIQSAIRGYERRMAVACDRSVCASCGEFIFGLCGHFRTFFYYILIFKLFS